MYLGFTVPEGRLCGALPMRMRGMLYDQLPLLPDGDQIQVRNPTERVPGIHGSISYLKLTFYVRSFFLISFSGRFRGKVGAQSRLDFARPRPYSVAGARYIFTIYSAPFKSKFFH